MDAGTKSSLLAMGILFTVALYILIRSQVVYSVSMRLIDAIYLYNLDCIDFDERENKIDYDEFKMPLFNPLVWTGQQSVKPGVWRKIKKYYRGVKCR